MYSYVCIYIFLCVCVCGICMCVRLRKRQLTKPSIRLPIMQKNSELLAEMQTARMSHAFLTIEFLVLAHCPI
jgi:hypothetical protein